MKLCLYNFLKANKNYKKKNTKKPKIILEVHVHNLYKPAFHVTTLLTATWVQEPTKQ